MVILFVNKLVFFFKKKEQQKYVDTLNIHSNYSKQYYYYFL